MQKYLIITGIVLAVLFGAGAVFALQPVDYSGKITARLDAAAHERTAAKNLYCEYVGDLTGKCYKNNSVACGQLATAETEYHAEFGSDIHQDCFKAPAPGTVLASGEIVESETGIPVQNPDDSLFFGDEGARK